MWPPEAGSKEMIGQGSEPVATCRPGRYVSLICPLNSTKAPSKSHGIVLTNSCKVAGDNANLFSHSPEARSQNSGVGRATLPVKPLWKSPPLPLAAPGAPRLSAVELSPAFILTRPLS